MLWFYDTRQERFGSGCPVPGATNDAVGMSKGISLIFTSVALTAFAFFLLPTVLYTAPLENLYYFARDLFSYLLCGVTNPTAMTMMTI